MCIIFFLFHGQFQTYFIEIRALFLKIHYFRRPGVTITFQQALTSAIDKKITLTRDAYSNPIISIRSCDLHVGKRAIGEIASYHERD